MTLTDGSSQRQGKIFFKSIIAQEELKMDEKTMTEKTEWKFSKNTDAFGDEDTNYVIPHELTVTITLKEYRELIKQASKEEVSKANSKWIDEYNENQKLKKEIEALHNALASLQRKESCDAE